MTLKLKKFIFNILFNAGIFLTLIIIIQNSLNKNKINFLGNETIDLPISFIIGLSFISGSISGSVISTQIDFDKNQN